MSLAGQAVDSSNISNLKDILLTYNKITETCFSSCVSSLTSTTLSAKEEACVNACSTKHIGCSQRLMGVFMELNAIRQQKMMEEAQAAAAAQEAASKSTEIKPVDGAALLFKQKPAQLTEPKT